MTATVHPIAGRVPANNLDAEAAVLSAAMLDAGALDVVLEHLRPGDLYSTAHQAVLEALAAIRSEGRPVDVVTVSHWLRAHQRLPQAGGARYLAQLVDATPAVAHVEHHCELVADLARQRKVVAACHEIAAEGYESISDVRSWLGTVEERVLGATSTGERGQPTALREVLSEVWSTMDERTCSEDLVETGFEDLDQFTGGLHRGDLIIVAARPGMGKSALVQCIANQVAEQPLRVAIFSLEMTKVQLGQRAISQVSGVPLSSVRNRRRHPVTQREQERITAAFQHLSRLPIHVDDTPGIQLHELRSKARRQASQAVAAGSQLGLVVVDYLQLMGSPRGSRSREEEVSQMSRGLKGLAKELRVPVIALSQLNRSAEARPLKDRKPKLSDLRESGAVEQDADQVWGVFREAYYSASSAPNEAEVVVLKNRSGGDTGTVPIGWHGKFVRFVDWRDR